MTAQPTDRRPPALHADLLVRGGAIHTFDGTGRPRRSLAVRDGLVVALGDEPGELDGLRGPGTTVLDRPDLTFLPGFFDTHNHMLRAGPDLDRVQLQDVRSIAELVEALRVAADRTPAGEWIVPSRNWHETNLAERRLPTAAELDLASTRHPIALRRGGHVLVANTRLLMLAGIDETSSDPPQGTVVRDASGRPTGVLIERPAFADIDRLQPVPDHATQLHQLERICREYNAHGITAIRDPGIQGDEFLVYQDARERGSLTVRSDVMLRLVPEWTVERMLDELRAWHLRTRFGDDVLRLGGIKIFLDGGIEGAAMEEPYEHDCGYAGHLFLDAEQLTEVVGTAVSRGWRVGCHAVGDRAVTTALDAYEHVQQRIGPLPPGHLVIEHAMLADAAQRRRAIALGVGITVQHPLLRALGGNMVSYWGEERTDRALPLREWVDEGALVAAGTDHNVTFYSPMLSIHGMVTRETAVAGVRGIGSAVDRQTAFELYTVAGARLVGDESRRGSLQPGRLADLAGYADDPMTCDIDALPATTPQITLVGGRVVHDRSGSPTDEPAIRNDGT